MAVTAELEEYKPSRAQRSPSGSPVHRWVPTVASIATLAAIALTLGPCATKEQAGAARDEAAQALAVHAEKEAAAREALRLEIKSDLREILSYVRRK